MLVNSAKRFPSRVPRISRRSFFDYLAVGKGEQTAAAKKVADDRVDWDFLEWYKPFVPQWIEQLENLRNFLSAQEQKSREPSPPYTKVNFDEWRAKIKDPQFVDQIEATCQAEIDIANSHKDPYAWFGWSAEAQKELAAERAEACRKYNLSNFEAHEMPKSKEELLGNLATVTASVAEVDVHFDNMNKELKLDYEQLEAERDMYGLKGEMMDFALHPQLAEMQEEMLAGKQTYVDHVMHEFEYSRFLKRERLLQLQDETQRQIFLENHKMALRVHGINASIGGSD